MRGWMGTAFRAVFATGLAVMCILSAGCEDESGVGDGAAFYISPGSYDLGTNETAVVLTAVGGTAPFTWSVSSTNHGYVSGTGTLVTYVRNDPPGANVIEVTDALGWSATAVVMQGELP